MCLTSLESMRLTLICVLFQFCTKKESECNEQCGPGGAKGGHVDGEDILHLHPDKEGLNQ